MDSSSDIWPTDVPRSLWQLDLLVPESTRAFPFVGIQVSWEFMAAFVAGAAIICAFAWRRFSEPSFDVNTPEFSDFKELSVWSLKDSASLRRAYLVYCLSLVFIFATLSFFGRMIVQILEQINVSGLQINVGTVEFDSWRWPLILALGIAGFAPLVNPLVPVENWLRRFSHEVVGIPTRLRETAIRIRTLIDGAPLQLDDSATDTAEREAEESVEAMTEWVKAQLGAKAESCLLLSENLGELVNWSYREHVVWSWPEIRRKLNEFERKVRDDTEAARLEFAYLTDPDKIPDRLVSRNPERQKEYQERLSRSVAALEKCRDRFSVIVAIYSEIGADFENVGNGEVREGLGRIDRMAWKDKPPSGLPIYAFVVVFVVYFLVIWYKWHPLIATVPHTQSTVAVSAGMETLKVFLLVWLPAAAVLTFLSVVGEQRSTASRRNDGRTWRRPPLSGMAAALAIAAIGMGLYAILYSALPARTVTQLRQNLLGSGPQSSMWYASFYYYLLFCVIGMVCYAFVYMTWARAKPVPFPKRFGLALIAGLSALGLLGLHVQITYGDACVVGGKKISIWQVLFWPKNWTGRVFDCFTLYSTVDLIVIASCVFLSVLGLTWRSTPRRRVAVATATATAPKSKKEA